MTNIPIIPEKPDTVQATPEQWKAIHIKGRNILVSASAGSGKTKVLVQRIMMHIKQGINLEELLVVTYTEAAAREMKERIQKSLQEEVNLEKDDTKRQHYIRQLQAMGKANISTIHAFCLTVIRRYFYLLNMDANFSLLSDGIEDVLLREKVWRQVQEQLLEQDDFEQLSLLYSGDRNDEGITSLMYDLYEFSRSNPDPIKWLRQLSTLYQWQGEWQEHPLVVEVIAPLIANEVELCVWEYQELIQELRFTDISDKMMEELQKELQLIQQLHQLVQDHNFTLFLEKIESMQFARWSAPKNSEVKDQLDVLKEKRNQQKEALKNIQKTYFLLSPKEQMEQLQQLAPMIEIMSKAAVLFYQALQQEKLRVNKVDFSDLEHMTLEILSHPEAVQYYKNLFKEVLVDEYQDVNRVQESILTAITDENMFMVGDVKQSIYGFRLADPTLFLQKYHAFENDKEGYRILLAENFRSRKQVLEFTNVVFKQLMSESLGQMVYENEAELITGNTHYEYSEDKYTELVMIETNELAEEFETKIETEIAYIAHRIKEMIANKVMVMDPDTGEHRPLLFKDIALLSPTKGNNQEIEQLFATYQIPVVIQKTEQYFTRSEIMTMVSVLRIVDNPYQDIPLVAVLRSGIVGLNEMQLGFIRKGSQKQYYFDSLVAFSTQELTEEVDYLTKEEQLQLQQKVQWFLELLHKWRNLANKQPLAVLISQIYQDTLFLEYAAGQTHSQQRMANLHYLYEKAKEYEESSFKGLHYFIRYIEQLQKKQKDLSEPALLHSGEDAVRVMTIHASKGLEFPVVFLVNMAKKFNLRDHQKDVLLSDVFGVGSVYINAEMRVKYPTFIRTAIQKAQETKDLSEEMRKLYVGMTRARDKLIMVGQISTREKFEANWSLLPTKEWILPESLRRKDKNFLSWIGLAIARGMKRDEVQYHLLDRLIDYDIRYVTMEELTQQTKQWLPKQEEFSSSFEQKLIEQTEVVDTLEVKRWFEGIHTPYRFEKESRTANFQTVTEIKRLFEEPNRDELPYLLEENEQRIFLQSSLPKPNFLMEQANYVKATDIGTAIHLLMQKLDLTAEITTDYVQKTITKLVKTGFIAPVVAQKIQTEWIVRFFTTTFGSWLQEQANQQVPIYTEQPFSFVLDAKEVFRDLKGETDSLLVHGIIDGYVELDHGIVLYDYKTDSIDSIEKVVATYKGQLNLYAQALESSLGKPVVRKVLCLLSIGENIVI